MSRDSTPLSVLTNLGELLAGLGGAESIDALATKVDKTLRWSADVSSVSMLVKTTVWRAYPGALVVQPTASQKQVFGRAAPLLVPPSELEPGGLLVPLRAGGVVVGVVQFSARGRAGIRDSDQPILRLLAIGLDAAVGRILALEGERNAKELAYAAIGRRTELLESLTHDIRNPLGALVTMAEFLEEDVGASLPSESQQDIARIRSCAARVCTLVDLLLEEPQEDARTFDLVALLSSVVTRTSWPERLVLELQIPESPGFVHAREDQVERLLENLISNAIKYSPNRGQVRVSGDLDAHGIQITVSDDGIGIPIADRETVFQRGGRAANVGDIHGTGLGLADARELARAAEGDLTFNESLTGGSEFVLRLPCTEESASPHDAFNVSLSPPVNR